MAWQRLRLSHLLAIFALLALAASGCGSDDSSSNSGNDCPAGQKMNPLSGRCQATDDNNLDAGDSTPDSSPADSGADTGTENDAGGPDDSGNDGSSQDAGTDSAGEDAEEDTDPPACPDRDGDGAADEACGGTDCDDSNPGIAPGISEMCDEHDNDCDGTLNQGIQCAFYAHSPNDLYLVDPFAKTATQVTTVPSNLFDLDTHPDGTLYGITSTTLYKFEQSTSSWVTIGSLGMSGNPNGLAINNQGTAFITASSTVYNVDLATGQATTIGSMGGTFNSSGDCVVNKDNSLYMSSSPTGFSTTDTLVLIDGNTGQAQEIGDIGQSSVYGLTAAWGKMYGLSGSGRLIEINSATGQGTLLHTFSGISWYGAASTPQR